MRKGVVFVLVFAAALMFVSAVYAYLPGDGHGKNLFCNVDPEKARKFQKETLSLRDQLITKKLEVRKLFTERHPDRDKIATLQKEIIDIRTTIMKKADESGMPKYHGRFKGCSWMQGKGIIKKCPNLTTM